ncbi:hypothetical protein TA3x_000115 [Tundrisphaera sp. TA3]|uniref:hypothetical protein n=1 Tax=Tundrisphaera sp. TA3 TaxID=3435775 RepID=UPI003EB9C1F1
MGIEPDRIKPRRASRPLVERLEGRDLPTAPTLLTGPIRALDLGALMGRAEAGQADPPDRQPTPRELARQRFTARFAGSFATGPPRFTDQASRIFIKGSGTSSAFLHGDFQMALYPPADRATGETTGLAALLDKNVANSGNLLLLDLQGDPSSLDRAGRPTRLTWTVDGSSGGTFSGATGEGTLEIRYRTGVKNLARSRSGGVNVIFRGRIETNGGVTNILLPI